MLCINSFCVQIGTVCNAEIGLKNTQLFYYWSQNHFCSWEIQYITNHHKILYQSIKRFILSRIVNSNLAQNLFSYIYTYFTILTNSFNHKNFFYPELIYYIIFIRHVSYQSLLHSNWNSLTYCNRVENYLNLLLLPYDSLRKWLESQKPVLLMWNSIRN